MTDADNRPAVVGQVERPVRPAAWVRDLGPQPHCVTDLRYCAAIDVERGGHLQYIPLYDQAAIDAARMAGVHSVHAQTTVIVRAALELLEAVEGCEAFPPEKMAAFRRVFGA